MASTTRSYFHFGIATTRMVFVRKQTMPIAVTFTTRCYCLKQ